VAVANGTTLNVPAKVSDIPTAAQNADGVLDEALGAHAGFLTTLVTDTNDSGRYSALQSALTAMYSALVSNLANKTGTKGTDNIYDKVEIMRALIQNGLVYDFTLSKAYVRNDAMDGYSWKCDITDKDGNPATAATTGPIFTKNFVAY
jgi:hypothetical protein